MKSYKGLVPRYLKRQPKRSMLTIFGLVLAVALITSTGILGASIAHSQIEYIKRVNGSHHGMFSGLTREQLNVLQGHAKFEKVGKRQQLGTCAIPGKGTAIIAASYDASAIEMAGMTLVNGEFPQKQYEIALEEWVLKDLGLSNTPGQRIHLKFTHNEYTQDGHPVSLQAEGDFILTGVLENKSISQISGYAQGVVASDTIKAIYGSKDFTYSALVQVKEGFSIKGTLEAVRQRLGLQEKNLVYNSSLLLALNDSSSYNLPYLFLGLIVIIATIAAIYNIFHISVLERIRQFGLLRSVGTTPKQIRRIVFGEALLLCIVSVPVGICLGILGVYGLVVGTGYFQGIVTNIVIPSWIIIWATGVSLIAIFVSAFRPACLAARISPLEAVRANSGVIKENPVKYRRWHRVVQAVFGVGGRMAYLNLWRQKKRFLITVFSMCIGIVLYIVFSYFVSSANPVKVLEDQFPADYIVGTKSINHQVGYSEQDLEDIKAIKGVEEVYATQERIVRSFIPAEKYTQEFKQYIKQAFRHEITADPDTGLYAGSAGLYGYSENILKQAGKYLVDEEIDIENMSKNPVVLVINNFPRTEGSIQVSNLKVGDEIQLQPGYLENNRIQYGDKKTFRIGGILRVRPFPADSTAVGLSFVVHEDVFKQFTGSSLYKRFDIEADNDTDPDYLESSFEVIAQRVAQGRVISFQREIDKLEREKNQFSVLFYGLIGVIVLIGVFSIINTISTNLLLRTREFGILRAVGTTNTQLKKMIIIEGLLYGIISSFWGVIAGNGLAYGLFHLVRKQMTYLTWTVPWREIALACLGSIILSILATVVPVKRISSMNIIESIRTIE